MKARTEIWPILSDFEELYMQYNIILEASFSRGSEGNWAFWWWGEGKREVWRVFELEPKIGQTTDNFF